MHEGAVCREIMGIVSGAARYAGLSKVWEITVGVGPYSCLHEGQLNFYFAIARAGTCMDEAVILLEKDDTLKGASQMVIKNIRGD